MNIRRPRSSRSRWHAQYTIFRQRLVDARLAAGLTQEEAAAKLGRSQSYVAKSETGERRVDAVELSHFCKAYGRSFRYFDPLRT